MDDEQLSLDPPADDPPVDDPQTEDDEDAKEEPVEEPTALCLLPDARSDP